MSQMVMAIPHPSILPVETIVNLLREQTRPEDGLNTLSFGEQVRRKRRIARIVGLLRSDAAARREVRRSQPWPAVAEHTATSCGVRGRAATMDEVHQLQSAVQRNDRALAALRNQAESAGLKVKPRAELGPLFMPVRDVWA